MGLGFNTLTPVLLNASASSFIGLEGTHGFGQAATALHDRYVAPEVRPLTQTATETTVQGSLWQVPEMGAVEPHADTSSSDLVTYSLVGAAILVVGVIGYGVYHFLPQLLKRSNDTKEPPVIPPAFSEKDVTDSMRGIGKGRNPKGRINPFSQTGHQLMQALQRGWKNEPPTAPAKPARPVIRPASPEQQQVSAEMAGVGATEDSPATESVATERESRSDFDVSMKVESPADLPFIKEFYLGQRLHDYAEPQRIGVASARQSLRVTPNVLGVADQQAIFRQDLEGRYWVRHVGYNKPREESLLSGIVSSVRSWLIVKATMVRRDKTDHTVPDNGFARLEPGDVVFVDGSVIVKKKKISRRIEINVTPTGLTAGDPNLFNASALWADSTKLRQQDIRRPLLKIKYNDEISAILYGYVEGAKHEQLEGVLAQVHQALQDNRQILVALEKDLRPGRSHRAAPELRLLQNAVAAQEDLEQLLRHELKQFVLEDVRLSHSRTDLIGSILLRLRQLRSYQADMIEHYIEKHLLMDRQAVMPFFDFYWQLPSEERRRFLGQVISVWGNLEPAYREMLWTLQGERRAALPPSYLRLITATAISMSRRQRGPILESHEAMDVKNLQLALERQLSIAHYIMKHQEQIPQAHDVAGNIRELDLCERVYETLGPDLKEPLRRSSEQDGNQETNSTLPSRFLRGYFDIRLSAFVTELFPIADGILLYRNGDYGFEETYYNRSKVEDIMVGHIEREFLSAMATRIEKWVAAGMPEPQPVRTVSVAPATKREGPARPATAVAGDDEDLDSRTTMPRIQATPPPAQPDFRRTLQSFPGASAPTPAEPAAPVKKRKRRLRSFEN